MTQIVWSPQALRDLGSIRQFIAQDSATYAGLTVQRIMAAVERLANFPESGRIIPELQRPNVREIIRPPYRIVYRLRGNVVEIVTVFRSTQIFPRLPE